MILDILGDSIDSVLGLMNFDLWVGAGDGVDFPSLFFLFEDGPLTNAHRQLEIAAGGVGRQQFLPKLTLLNH